MIESATADQLVTDSFATLDELDLAIINALQVNGRASWALIGQVLGISPLTAARRWQRLVDDGVAWMTAYGGPFMWEENCVGFVEVDCDPASTRAIAAALAAHRQAVSVEYTGGSSLFVMTVVADVTGLSDYLRNQISAMPGVRGTNVHISSRVFTEASRWQLRSLTKTQQAQLASTLISPSVRGGLQAGDQPLLRALSVDGRRSYTELAEILGISASTVRRRLRRMMRADVVRFQCDVANAKTQWPVQVRYQARCPAADIDLVGRALASLPEVRVCVAAMGTNNMQFSVWLRSIASSLALEGELAKKLPQLSIAERAVTMHWVKRAGRLLDDDGHSIGVVPMF